MRNRQTNRGFTLAELLIVIAIIAVLVAVAIPVFTSSLEKARESTCKANRRSLLGLVATTAMLEDDFWNAKAEVLVDLDIVLEALEKTGNTFTDQICPSGGTIKVVRVSEEGGFQITCDKHSDSLPIEDGRTDWLSGEKDATDLLKKVSGEFHASSNDAGDDYKFFRAYQAATGGTLQTADPNEALGKFPAGAKLSYGKYDNGLAWTGVRVCFDGGPHDILMLTTGKNASNTSGNPALQCFLFYYNGHYYRSNTFAGDSYSMSGLYGGQNNKGYSFDEFLTAKNFVLCD